MKKMSILTALLFSMTIGTSIAQPWRSIESPYFRLIFPADIESSAQLTAAQLDNYLTLHLDELPVEAGIRKIDVVLQTATHESNGFVGMFPYRSVWLNKPMPLARMEWYDLLAVHEGRHVIQLNQWRDSPWLSLVGGFFGGDVAVGASLMLLPEWYWEGDATVSETVYTQGGRGRVAAFDLWYRTDVLNYEAYNYDRTILGTGFERYPFLSEYVFGYYLTGYLRMNYGDDLFEQLFERLGRWEGSVFNAELKKLTGKSIEQHHAEMTQQLRQRWQDQRASMPMTDVTQQYASDADTWQSVYPIGVDGDDLWMLQVGVDGYSVGTLRNGQWRARFEVPAAVARSYYSGLKAKTLSVQDGRVCWVQERTALFSSARSFGDIRCWSNETGYRWLSHQQKYTSVVQYAGGFIAHRFDASRNSELVWLDADLQITSKLPLPQGTLAHDLSVRDSRVTFVMTGNDSPGIYSVSSAFELSLVVEGTAETQRAPVFVNDEWLVFSSDHSGIDQVVLMHVPSQQRWQTGRPYGAYFPVLDEQSPDLLWFADYQVKGQQLVSVPMPNHRALIDQRYWTPAARQAAKPALFIQPLIDAVSQPNVAGGAEYTVQPYRPWQHLWNPTDRLITTDFQQVVATVSSQNVLDTLQIQLSAGYDFEEESMLAAGLVAYRFQNGLKTIVQGSVSKPEQSLSTAVLTPMQWQWADRTALAVPSIGVAQHWSMDNDANTLVQADLTINISSDRPMFTLSPKQSFEGLYLAHYDLQLEDWSMGLQNRLTVAGWHPLHALSIGLQAQQLAWDAALIESKPFFDAPVSLGLTGQVSLEYTINTGAQGLRMGPVAYVRNTNVSVGAHYQNSEEANEQRALSVSISPSIAMFRTSMIRVWPELTLAYEFEQQNVHVGFSVDLGF